MLDMETSRKLSEIEPTDLAVVERLFGQQLSSQADGFLILKTPEPTSVDDVNAAAFELPAWLNVLEGMSDADLADFDKMMSEGIWLGRRA